MSKISILTAALVALVVLVVASIDSLNNTNQLKNDGTALQDKGGQEVTNKVVGDNAKELGQAREYESSTSLSEQVIDATVSKQFKQEQVEKDFTVDNKSPEADFDPLNIAALNVDEIEVIYNFSQLQANADNSLRLNEDTVTVLAGLFNTQSLDDIQPHLTKIQGAAAISLPLEASHDFSRLVNDFGLLNKKILDDDEAFTNPGINIDTSASLAEKLIAYQDAYLGKETAAQLFYLERAHFKLYGQLEEEYGQEIPNHALETLKEELTNLAKERNLP